jgi:type II secretory pathway pseudopilin PulG
MSAPRLMLDFEGQRRSGGVAGVLLAVLGIAAVAGAWLQLRSMAAQREGLELRREALARVAGRNAELTQIRGLGSQDTIKTVRELATPWSQLLGELESASSDNTGSVAILAIEPDHAKHRVKVTAEARNLPVALAYVKRLKQTHVLRYAMLDSHEVRADVREHPVRFQLSADWTDAT